MENSSEFNIGHKRVGKIKEIKNDGTILIETKCYDYKSILEKGYKSVLVEFFDKRNITPKQRNMIWAILGEIAEWMGDTKGNVNETMKQEFNISIGESPDEIFSLSDIKIEKASAYQKFLIDFVIQNGIPTKVPIYSLVGDMKSYLYSCLINKRCCVCGSKADLHHVERIGMGRDRTDIVHIGMDALPLCREHHTEAHTMPDSEFFSKYHIDGPIKIDKKICSIYGLRGD